MLNHEPAVTYAHIPLQPASVDIWDEKYRLRANDGTPVEDDIDGTYRRVAKALAKAEKRHLRKKYEKLFSDALKMGATGAGRIMSNAGAEVHKTAVSLINCTVSNTIGDSMEAILQANKEAGLTLKAGCGIGYEFSTIRPNGAHVNGAGAATSGPLPFMDIFDRTCATVKSAGARRGAQMGTFDVTHPDVVSFITAKREDGRLRNFNLSLLITDEFIEAVRADAMWEFKWEGKPFYRTTNDGLQIKAEMPAKELWDLIMKSTYDFAEPGFLLIDRINQYNNLWFIEHLRATNPCGEQPLPPYGSCLLGSILATMFVINPFTPEARFDWDKYYQVCRIFARMLDNVVESNNLPLAEQRREIENKRRHGMGYFGAGSAMVMLGMKYGSPESVAFTDELTKQMAFANYEEGALLAKEKGEAPVLQEVYNSDDIIAAGHAGYNRNIDLGTQKTFTGRELFLSSHYFDAFRTDEKGRQIMALLEEHGCRYTHGTSIAPTGTISFSFGNNCSNGIEPSFTHYYSRNVIRPGRKTKEAVDVYSYEYLLYRELVDREAKPVVMTAEQLRALLGRDGPAENEQQKKWVADYCLQNHILPPQFADTSTLTPKEHVDVQAAAQKWVDSSISKTINIDTNYPFEDFKMVYLYAYEKGLKGCTTYRYNPEAFTGVLVKKDDLANTSYNFTLADGSVVNVVGGETLIEYDGATHTASNLYDAIKEGLYGRM